MKQKNTMKLFAWTNFSPDYCGGLAIAIAHDELEARKLIEASRGYEVTDWGDLHVHRIDQHRAYSVTGGGQ